MNLTVLAPLSGVAVPLSAVPDPVFSQSLVGPGMAIDPALSPAEVLAPIAGYVAKLHPHAFVIVGVNGRGVLVHLGIDTVQLKGAGFEVLVAEGDNVAAGTPIVRWDPAAVASSGRSTMCPVVALDAPADHLSERVESGPITAGTGIFIWV